MSGIFYKFLFVLNTIAALALLLGYLFPYIPPTTSSSLSVLGLFLPVLIGINMAFLLLWGIALKRYFFLSFIVLALGYSHITSIFQWHQSPSETSEAADKAFRMMSYNVRLLNRHQWIEDELIPQKIAAFVESESPDIVGLQEFYGDPDFKLDNYPYYHIREEQGESGQALFSKWPILKKGNLAFSGSVNHAIFADIAVGKDTLRVFNIHLESLGIDPDEEVQWNRKSGERWVKNVGYSFQKQENQVKEVITAIQSSPYRVVVMGDFNNTSTSYVYHELTDFLKDTFKEAGRGFGRTYNFRGYPLRIDMILVDWDVKVIRHKNFNTELSDHYPIVADLSIP